jgi:hypothetical protein
MFNAQLLPVAATALAMTASALAGSTADVVIYAINHQGNFPDFGDTLIRFSADDTEGYETIGATGLPSIGMGGLEFDGDGNLWGYATFNNFGGAASGLYSMNMMTGQATAQGTLSSQTLNDLAWNPVNQTMYGVYSQGFATGRLYTINLQTGAVSVVGPFNGLDAQNNLIGIGIDSLGTIYLYDNMNNKIYVSDENLNLTLLYDSSVTQCEGCELAVGSQGIGVDWSRDDLGYHGAAGQGMFPNYYGNLNTFALDGSGYVWGPDFGPNLGTGPQFPPQVQAGDVAIVPAGKTMPGDLDGDGDVDGDDRQLFCSAIGSSSGDRGYIDAADMNDDGDIDHLDQQLFNTILPVCGGDIVSSDTFQPPPDGTTDAADLAFLLGAWASQPSCADFVSSRTFAPPPDGAVDGADLAFLLGAWGACE